MPGGCWGWDGEEVSLGMEWKGRGPSLLCPVSLLSPCPAGPPCPSAATPLAFSSPPRRTLQLRRISGMRWCPVASSTSIRKSSKCFPRYVPDMVVWEGTGGQCQLTMACMIWGKNKLKFCLCPCVLMTFRSCLEEGLIIP